MPFAARWSERPHLFGMPQPVAPPVQRQLLPGTGQCPLHPLKHVKGGGLLGGMNETPVQGRFSGSVMWFVHSISPDKNHAVGQRGVKTRSCAGPLSAVAVFFICLKRAIVWRLPLHRARARCGTQVKFTQRPRPCTPLHTMCCEQALRGFEQNW